MQANLNQGIWLRLLGPSVPLLGGNLGEPPSSGMALSTATTMETTISQSMMAWDIPTAASKTFHNSRDDNWEDDAP